MCIRDRDISQVEEIIRLQPITKVPGAPDFVEGVINLRGRVIPVIDLRKRFHLPPREETKNTRIVVVEVPPNTCLLYTSPLCNNY